MGIEVAGTEMAIPALESSESGDECGFGLDVDAAVGDHLGESREAVEAVGVNAIARGIREQAGAERGALGLKAKVQRGALQGGIQIVVGNSEHGAILRAFHGWSEAESSGASGGPDGGASFHISVGAAVL
jgi:hypothetical protein